MDEHDSLNEDSIELAHAYELQHKIKPTVYPIVETEPVEANSMDDAADDPAIWINKKEPSKSLLFGSNKKGGIIVNTLDGKTQDYYPVGKVNNIDVLYDIPMTDTSITLLGGSNRSTQSIDLFKIDSIGKLTQLSDNSFNMDSTKIDDIYGFCFGKDKNEESRYVFVNGKNGLMQQYLLNTEFDSIWIELVREVQFESQTEGMVVDYHNQKLYVGEEDKGIWILDVDPQSVSKSFLSGSGSENENIVFDVEGLTIYQNKNTSLLLASSQGNFSYAVFDINSDHQYLGSFIIAEKNSIDGVEETDGIDIVSDSISTEFPKGIFVVQDGFNYQNDTLVAQNFKVISVSEILSVFNLNN